MADARRTNQSSQKSSRKIRTAWNGLPLSLPAQPVSYPVSRHPPFRAALSKNFRFEKNRNRVRRPVWSTAPEPVSLARRPLRRGADYSGPRPPASTLFGKFFRIFFTQVTRHWFPVGFGEYFFKECACDRGGVTGCGDNGGVSAARGWREMRSRSVSGGIFRLQGGQTHSGRAPSGWPGVIDDHRVLARNPPTRSRTHARCLNHIYKYNPRLPRHIGLRV